MKRNDDGQTEERPSVTNATPRAFVTERIEDSYARNAVTNGRTVESTQQVCNDGGELHKLRNIRMYRKKGRKNIHSVVKNNLSTGPVAKVVNVEQSRAEFAQGGVGTSNDVRDVSVSDVAVVPCLPPNEASGNWTQVLSTGQNMDKEEEITARTGHVSTTTTCAGLSELASTLPSVEKGKRSTGEGGEVNVGAQEHYGHDWGSLPSEALLQIFSHLTVRDLGRVARICCHWRFVSQHPLLWQRIEFNLSHNKCDAQPTPTPAGLIDHVLRHHARHLKFVVFKTDSSVESARTACRILARLVNCSLKTLSLISSARPVFLDVDQDSFVSALTVVLDHSKALSSLAIDHTPVDDPSLEALATSSSSRTLQLLKMKSCPRVSPEGILALADHCRYLRELSLSYTLLSDNLLLALSSERHVRLEKLRVDIHADDQDPTLPRISPSSWASLVAHSPGMDVILYSFVARDETFDGLFTSYVPVTHLFFGDYAPKRVLGRLGLFCPRLKELVVGANGNSFLDEELQGIARGCSSLECLGLAECEVTCSGFVEVVRLCKGRLKQLFVTEECLVEDRDCDLVQMCKAVSELMGREWWPEFVPCW